MLRIYVRQIINKFSLFRDRPRIYVCSHGNNEAVDIYPQLDHTDIRLLDNSLSPILRCSGKQEDIRKALEKLVAKKDGKIDRFKVFKNRFNQQVLQFHAHFYQNGNVKHIRRIIRFS